MLSGDEEMGRQRTRQLKAEPEYESSVARTPETTARPPEHPMLHLQRTIGNHAAVNLTTRPRLQRMPTRQRVVGILGKPHGNILWVKQSTKYKHALDQLDAFHTYTQNTPAGNHAGDVMTRMARVMELYNAVIDACDAYQGETGDKAEYFLRLKLQIQNEKTSAIGALATYAGRVNSMSTLVRGRNMLSSILTTSGPDSLDMDQGSFIKNVGGGINQLGVYNHGGQEQYFKTNRDNTSGPGRELEQQLVAAAESGNVDEQQRLFKEQMSLVTLNDVATTAGIPETDSRLANRDVALYRLDQLLGANLIARTQFALRNTGNGPEMGSLMVKAQGTKAGDLVEQGKVAKDSTSQRQNPGSVNIEDPNLQRLLSRLQLLDTLAFQVDRNLGNFYVQFDQSGRVTGVTGIDNDMSFGTKTGINERAQELPGLAKFVDKEMAEKLINIEPRLVMLILSDVLNGDELAALNDRLLKLKLALAKMQSEGKLLSPTQWDQMTSAAQINDIEEGIKQDRTTYHGQFGRNAR